MIFYLFLINRLNSYFYKNVIIGIRCKNRFDLKKTDFNQKFIKKRKN